MNLDAASYPTAAFPSRAEELAPGEALRETFGAWPSLLGVGFVVTAALIASADDEALGVPKGVVTGGILVFLAGLCLAIAGRRRRRRVTLAIRGGEVGVYRDGTRVGVSPIAATTSVLLNAGVTLRDLLCSLGAAAIPVAVALRGPAIATAAGLAWSAVFLGGALSTVRLRLRCRHFLVPVGDRRRRIALRAADGDALLAVLPRAGGWQEAE
jgi:hypothetical protein